MRLFKAQMRGPDHEGGGIFGHWHSGMHTGPEMEKILRSHRAIPIPGFNIAGQAVPPMFKLKRLVVRNMAIFL
ncbi:hypothetical protein MD484_g8677, partial [Candolleomyces efflorescens]